MTITATLLGTRSKLFAMSGETGMSGLISSIEGYLTTPTQPGWTLHDSIVSADGGGLITKVYKCLNKDGITYKFLILRFETLKWKMLTSTCEDWNATTHTAINEAWCFADTMYMGLLPNSSELLILASPTYVIFQNFIKNDPGIWQGVVETEREAPEDTAAAGYPCWGWVNGQTFLQQYVGTVDHTSLSMPRTRDGSTGLAAAQNFVPVSSMLLQETSVCFADLGIANSKFYGWDTNKKHLHSIRNLHPRVSSTMTNYGRMFGLKATSAVGELLNKVSVPVDGDLMYSEQGTPTDHWVLPLVGKVPTSAFPVGSVGGGLTIAASYVATCSQTVASVFDGLAYYIGSLASIGITKIDATTSYVGNVSGTAGLVTDLIYDGAQYIYAVAGTNLYRMDTLANDAVTTLVLAAAGSVLTQDKNNVFVADSTSRLQPKVFQISKSTFTLTSTYNLTVLAQAGTIAALSTDYSGVLHVLTLANLPVFTRITISTGAAVSTNGLGSPGLGGLLYDASSNNFKYACYLYNGQTAFGSITPAGVFTQSVSNSIPGPATARGLNYRIDIVPAVGRYVCANGGTSISSALATLNSWTSSQSSGFGTGGHPISGLSYDGVRFMYGYYTASVPTSAFVVLGNMNNKFQRGTAVPNMQVLFPV